MKSNGELEPWDVGYVKPTATAMKTETVEVIQPLVVAEETTPVEKRKPGRPLHSQNKLTAQTRGLLQNVFQQNVERLNEELQTLHGKEYIDAMVKIAEFFLPKMNKVEFSDAEGKMVDIKQVFYIGGTRIEF